MGLKWRMSLHTFEAIFLFWTIDFIISWVIWFIFADKKRWREIFPVCTFSLLLGAMTDTIMHHYKLWEYDDDGSILPYMVNEFGVYTVFTYLFIQHLPKDRMFKKNLVYWLVWTVMAVAIEWIYLKTGHIEYKKWWNMGWSYFADWILLWLFYQYHKVFRFEKLP